MREILFRAKSKVKGDWVEGCLVRRYNGYVGIDRPHPDLCFELIQVEPETVGQYTGLKDLHGTRIFEGDVLSGHLDDLFPKDESRYEVVWYDYGWHIKSGNGFFDTMEQNWVNMLLEVIGNIYDNPELLEVEEHE